MTKIIAMIPARIGSQRVKKKNLRLLNGKPLIAYVIETAINTEIFDEVYVNSESDLIGDVALKYGAKYYKRPPEFSTHNSNNDEFAYDFIKKIDGDILIQILPTSPFITIEEIINFVKKMTEENTETMVSVINHKIACLLNKEPLNFKYLEPHISSQDMVPIQSYATALMGWTYSSFKRSMEKYNFAYHGTDTKKNYFVLKGLSEIDIDNEEDFILAEITAKYIEQKRINNKSKIKYYEVKK
jgi:CMP-N-acetylneuraminic acid synthetase